MGLQRNSKVFGLLLVLFTTPASVVAQAKPTYTSFDVQSGQFYLNPWKITADGFIAGEFADARHIEHGFLLKPDGTVSVFDAPKAVNTITNDMNSKHWMVGWFVDAAGIAHGYVLSPTGHFQTFEVKGSSNTFASGINSKGYVSGFWTDADGLFHGYVRRPSGTVETYDVPGATGGTYGYRINKIGRVTGFWIDHAGCHGFLRDLTGAITTYDVPNGSTSIQPGAINDDGWVAGYGSDGMTSPFAFVRDPSGVITSFRAFVRSGSSTYPRDINNKGTVVGSTERPSRGFLWSPTGKITTFHFPGVKYTQASTINENGVVAGSYYDDADRIHGFIRRP